MNERLHLSDLLKAAYAEGIKVALVHHGYDESTAYGESEKLAESYPHVEFRLGPEELATRSTESAPARRAERKGLLGRLLPSASLGATLGVLGGGALGAARSPGWRKQFMKLVRNKKDGGVLKAIKEMAGDTAGIQSYAIPGAIGGGAVGLMGRE